VIHLASHVRSILSKAEIIAVGTELLTPFRSDTNSLFLTARLNELGIEVCRKSIVSDESTDLASAVRDALERTDLLIVCGGLGPTDDDRTRETVSDVLGLALKEDPLIINSLIERFSIRKLTMPENNRRQALVPVGAVVIDNPNGTAPGLWIEAVDQVVVLLPGPPRELEPMFTRVASDRLSGRVETTRLYRRVLRVVGRGESHVEEATHPIYERWRRVEPQVLTTILASPGLVELHLSTRTRCPDVATAVLDDATSELATILGDHLLSADGRSLSEVVGGLLERHDLKVAVGESCTGGLVTARLVDTPGSSRYVGTGLVAYSNEGKRELLGVDPDLLKINGAVSEAVAVAMAEGARKKGVADIGVGVTGVAGPSGGSEEKPVGTVCFGIVGPGNLREAKTELFVGNRSGIRLQASQTALDLLRRVLLRRM